MTSTLLRKVITLGDATINNDNVCHIEWHRDGQATAYFTNGRSLLMDAELATFYRKWLRVQGGLEFGTTEWTFYKPEEQTTEQTAEQS